MDMVENFEEADLCVKRKFTYFEPAEEREL